MTNAIYGHVWEMALQFPETHARHTILVDLLAALKRNSPDAFDPEVGSRVLSHRHSGGLTVLQDPQLVFSKDDLKEVAWE